MLTKSIFLLCMTILRKLHAKKEKKLSDSFWEIFNWKVDDGRRTTDESLEKLRCLSAGGAKNVFVSSAGGTRLFQIIHSQVEPSPWKIHFTCVSKSGIYESTIDVLMQGEFFLGLWMMGVVVSGSVLLTQDWWFKPTCFIIIFSSQCACLA